ncbi:condensin complex subunit 1 [Rhizoctonia solani AG-3 Rhs1AP]|uniref:Condensin complex subunit 1 n=1 Tax=Rhizoctonia solani AG-3 Rhs1AP TaxID=1086054 RepID=X8IUX8_9AGAM|nr:condensin complex subunit 1 [Rhizoctonia solani AG-3 Rhs1AP]
MGGFQLLNENQKLQNVEHYSIPNEIEIGDMDERAITRVLEGVVESVADNHEAITDPEAFDVYRSLLKHAERLSGGHLSKMLDSLLSGFQAEANSASNDVDADDNESFSHHRTALEMYAFLLHWFCATADKQPKEEDGGAAATKPKRGKGKATGGKRTASSRAETWSWAEAAPQTLSVIAKILKIKSGRLWVSSSERRTFIDTLTRPAYTITESESLMKDEAIRVGIYKILCVAVKHHDHAQSAQTLIMQSVQLHEHLSEPMAEILSILGRDFDYPQLTEVILRELGNKTFNAQDTKTPRSFSKFLLRLTTEVPRLVLTQFPLIQNHIDSESYTMRMALVEIIGLLIKEVAEDELFEEGQKEKRLNSLFTTLLARFMDVSTYVRARLLATLTKLCELPNKFPAQRLRMATAVVCALKDRASTVRKNAVVLLTKLILTHPYGLIHGGPLNREEWEAGYEKVCNDLQALGEAEVGRIEAEAEMAEAKAEPEGEDMEVDEEEEEEEEDEDEGEDGGGGEERRRKKTKKVKVEKQTSALDLASITEEQLGGNDGVRLRLTKRYYADALNFMKHIELAMESVEELLTSTYKSETLEAIEFFRVCYNYEMKAAAKGIKNMIHLIWSKDTGGNSDEDKEVKGVRLRLIECYRHIYFDPRDGLDPKSQVNRVAKNMIELTYDSTVAELTSLEELMRTMAEDNQIHPDIINTPWQVYGTDNNIPKAQRRGAIVILGMIALAKQKVVTDRIDTLLHVGLGPLGKEDLVLARYTCVALQRVSGSHKKVKGSLVDKSTRLPMTNVVFTRLRDAIEYPSSSKEWFGMAEQAINTIYQLGEQPDTLCSDLIKTFTRRVFAPPAKTAPPAENTGEDDEMADGDGDTSMQAPDPTQDPAVPEPSQQPVKSGDIGNAFHLSQMVFVVGHVALKHIVHLELVEREWKRRKDEATKAEKKPAKGSKAATAAVDDIEQVAGNAEDDIGDMIQSIREKELLSGPNSLLALYGPMIKEICGTPKTYKNQILRMSATLALSKLMCVSSKFCEDNLLLLFKLMESSRNPIIRSNIIIALGDIAICFNNMIDENSDRLYDGLSDPDLTVKKNTLMVLTHLILNGMIKVKGQLGEMAKCLEDEDKRIADLAKLFFQELSTKDNAIYNNLPDVISHLSVGEHSVPEEAFQSTMSYIFKFIEKEKQAETIVEKLCQRFRSATEERQWRDIAFCLSMLPYKSERSVKKLIEGLPFYQDKLHEETVFMRFNDILAKAKQNKSANKPDTELNEFENILKEHKNQGEQDNELAKRTEHNVAVAQKRASRRSARKRQKSTHDED